MVRVTHFLISACDQSIFSAKDVLIAWNLNQFGHEFDLYFVFQTE